VHVSPSPDIIRAKFLRPSDFAARLLPSQNQMCAAVYRQRHLVKATEVTAGLAESNGSLLPGLWSDSLHVTCGLTACTPGSAPGPTLGNEYGKTLPVLPYLCLQPPIYRQLSAYIVHFIHTIQMPSTLLYQHPSWFQSCSVL